MSDVGAGCVIAGRPGPLTPCAFHQMGSVFAVGRSRGRGRLANPGNALENLRNTPLGAMSGFDHFGPGGVRT